MVPEFDNVLAILFSASKSAVVLSDVLSISSIQQVFSAAAALVPLLQRSVAAVFVQHAGPVFDPDTTMVLTAG